MGSTGLVPVGLESPRRGRLEGGAILLGVVEQRELRLEALLGLEQFGAARAVLAEQPLEQRQAILDLVETARLGFGADVVQAAAQLARQLLDPRLDLAELGQRRGGDALPGRHFRQRVAGLREPVGDRVVPFVEQREGPAQSARDRLMMAQEVAAAAQLVLLAGDRLRGGDLAGLEAQEIDALGAEPGIALQPLETLGGGRVLGIERRDPARQLPSRLAAEPVQPLALEPGIGEPQLVALAVDPQQARRQVLQQAQRDRLILDEDAIAPFARNLPAHDELVLLDLDAHSLELCPERGIAGEDPGNGGAFGAFANQVARGAGAGEQRQRIDHQGLAGSGLAGEHVQAGTEVDLAPSQDRQISHAQSEQHGRLKI